MNIFGINAYHGDACAGFPAGAADAVLAQAGITEDPEFFGKSTDIAHSAQVVYEEIFFRVLAQPAAGDDGTAVAAAFYVERAVLGRPRRYVTQDAHTAVSFTDKEIELVIEKAQRNRWDSSIDVRHLEDAVPLVLNTSFNEHEPILATPDEALACYLRTRMDVLALGNWVLSRPPAE